MCEECRQIYCPDECPNAFEGKGARCDLCGVVREKDELYGDLRGRSFCVCCIEELDVIEILRICGASSVLELLLRCGILKNTRKRSNPIKKTENKCSEEHRESAEKGAEHKKGGKYGKK